jgi:hypothetical protein
MILKHFSSEPSTILAPEIRRSIEQGLQLRYDLIDDIFRGSFAEAAATAGDVESARLIAEDHALHLGPGPGKGDGKASIAGVVAAQEMDLSRKS